MGEISHPTPLPQQLQPLQQTPTWFLIPPEPQDNLQPRVLRGGTRPRGEKPPPRKSRRITLRKARKKLKQQAIKLQHENQQYYDNISKRIEKYRLQQVNHYGFCADPTKPTWLNQINFIKCLPKEALGIITNRRCHNYCDPPSLVPQGLQSLLGLGLKYCIKYPRPTNRISKTVKRFKNDIRRIYHFKYHPPADDDPHDTKYIPELYISAEWVAPVCPDKEVEKALSLFESTLIEERGRFYKNNPSNLLPSQFKLINKYKSDDNIIVLEADKNMGGSTLLRDTYIHHGITEHLGDTNVYRPLTKREATIHQNVLRNKVVSFTRKWRALRVLTKAETIYLQRAVENNPTQFARFRMSLKVHKTPWKLRPIVCSAGTFINNLSCWLDYQLQKLKHLIPTYIKDSGQLLDKLDELDVLESGSKLFTADANSMYTNINTDHAIQVNTVWLGELNDNGLLPDKFPTAAVIEAMGLVMRNNVFVFGDLYFLQLTGTAMGTSSACMWATIYFAIHEMNTLIPRYSHCLSTFNRFIDDMFGIWTGTDEEFEQFKADTNNYGILTWEFEEPTTSVDFLDLTISIDHRRRITTKTYQKPLNLYQYIPPMSAHPPNMIKGIIYSLMKNYYRQNTLESDYYNMAVKLFERHAARGWDRTLIKSLILDADRRIKSTPPSTTPPTPTPPTLNIPGQQQPREKVDTLYLHWQYHPNDISRKQLRSIYDRTCKKDIERVLDITKLVIAYSKPPNIKEALTKAKLHQATGREASKFYSGELP